MPAPAHASEPIAGHRGDTRSLPTATYITGNSTLEPGRRYAFRIDELRLELLGPLEIDPSSVALQLDIHEMDATSVAGRLLISQPTARSAPVLAFMSVAGATPDGLVATILAASRAARGA